MKKLIVILLGLAILSGCGQKKTDSFETMKEKGEIILSLSHY